MNFHGIAALTIALAATTPSQLADGLACRRIQDACAQARPTADQLGVFRLDWAPDLDAARARAARERKPIALLVIRNISGGGDIHSGHC